MPTSTTPINVIPSTAIGERLLAIQDGPASGDSADPMHKARTKLSSTLHQKRLMLLALVLVDVLVGGVLIFATYHFDPSALAQALRGPYALESSFVDSLCLLTARVLSMASQSAAGWWCGLGVATLTLCKAIVYDHPSQPAAGNALVFAAVAVAAAELLACGQCISCRTRAAALASLHAEARASGVVEEGKYESRIRELVAPRQSSLRGTMRILRPYFLPTGVVSKLRTSATFFVMAGSKACNLCAPLYIGQAAQTLSDGRVPYKELAIYCGLRFGSSALSELQKLIYIRVKCACSRGVQRTTASAAAPRRRRQMSSHAPMT